MSTERLADAETEAAYWRRRAEEQRAFARAARTNEAIAAHEAIVSAYLKRAERDRPETASGGAITVADTRKPSPSKAKNMKKDRI